MQNESHQEASQNSSQSQSINFGNLAPVQESQENNLMIQGHPQQQINQQQQKNMPISIIQRPLPNMFHLKHQNKPRLIIDQIILQNFKSYADKQVIGPFHENFTSVVGPNGSGKSNLIESMLFIFGYNASWMRLKRLNQLIHKSSTKPNVDKASVEVRFKKIIQNTAGKFQEVPGSFSLKRVVKQAGTSKYYVDNSESTQNQVKQKLKGEGIDLNNNRFLILQGEVQQISQMKQKSGDRDKPGLLEYLQDIIGSNVYIQQIENLVTQYNQIEQTKHEKGQLMKLVEIQLKNMRKGKQQAIKFVKKQRYIYQLQNMLHQVTIYNNKNQSNKLQQKLQQAEAEKQRIISEQKQKLKKQAERFKQLKKLKTEIQTFEKQLYKDQEIMQKLNQADRNLNQEISFKSEDLVRFNRKIDELDKQLANIINQSDQIKQKLPINKNKAKQLKNNIDQIAEQLAKHDKPHLKAKIKTLQNSMKKCQHQLKSFTEKQKITQKYFDSKFNRKDNYEIQLLDLNRKIDEQTQMLQKIGQAESQATKIKENLSADLDNLSKERKTVFNQLQTVQGTLRQNLHQSRQMNMFNNMFEKIMQQRIPGVLGRLGDLGTVNKKYDEIITSCCSRLDNIVVKDYDAANAVLNFLKATKLGRVTCIILDKIQDYGHYMRKPWNNLPNSIRLFDQIEPRMQQVRLAFYFAISDTIYCENSNLGLQYAMKDDRNRRRVVSKKSNGYIIYQLNGLMNGCPARKGGFQVKAKSKVRNNTTSNQDIKHLQKSKQQLQQKIRQLQQRYRSIKNEIENVDKDLSQINREKKSFEQSVRQAKIEVNDIEKNMLKNTKQAQEQKNRKYKQLQAIRNKIVALNNQKATIISDIEDVEREQKQLESQKITSMRQKLKELKNQYTIVDKQVQKQTAIIETTVKRINQNKKIRKDYERKVNMLQVQVEKLKKEIEIVENKATQIFARLEQNQQKMKQSRSKQEELKVLEEKQQNQVKQSKIKIERAKEEVDRLRIQINAFEQTVKNAKNQLQKTRQTYKQLSITYDFLDDIDAIDSMNIQNIRKHDDIMHPGDTSVIMNRSLDSNLSSSSKVFPLQKLMEYSPFDEVPEEKIQQFVLFPEKISALVIAQKETLKKMSSNNLQIITQYRNKFMDFKQRYAEFEAVKQAQMALRKKIQELKQKRLTTFRQGFTIINSKLKQVYQFLTRGGDAQLQLIDSLDPFSDGINFSVRPPKKTWKQINKLSGGQKTLSSLSLIFALHYFKPTPLYFMDEIDAALDFRNVSIVADYVKQRTKNAQFIIISLRNNMFELANKLVGVYKTYDKTKIVQLIPSRTQKHKLNGNDKQNLDLSNRD